MCLLHDRFELFRFKVQPRIGSSLLMITSDFSVLASLDVHSLVSFIKFMESSFVYNRHTQV